VDAVALAADGRHVAVGNKNGTVYVLRLAEAGRWGGQGGAALALTDPVRPARGRAGVLVQT